jgi:hypothetical protein
MKYPVTESVFDLKTKFLSAVKHRNAFARPEISTAV